MLTVVEFKMEDALDEDLVGTGLGAVTAPGRVLDLTALDAVAVWLAVDRLNGGFPVKLLVDLVFCNLAVEVCLAIVLETLEMFDGQGLLPLFATSSTFGLLVLLGATRGWATGIFLLLARGFRSML